MIRLFVAIPLPELVRTQLTMLQSGLQGARWIKPDNIHLTLRFIGEVPNDLASDIDTALSEITAPPFELELDGIGSFARGKHPHALWVGVSKSEALLRLQAKIESALVRTGLAAEERKFSAHITIARLKEMRPNRVEAWVADHGAFKTAPFQVDRFALFSSFLKTEGALYIEEASYPLEGFGRLP
ncbi:MAG: RNA 2',3'-cyclic phosphodiesterase [Alphaproteobacteria bacterium]|nr:RNA 2',3'-cyclic phosphodiesterase [Alphaproteobacteria bacterium]